MYTLKKYFNINYIVQTDIEPFEIQGYFSSNKTNIYEIYYGTLDYHYPIPDNIPYSNHIKELVFKTNELNRSNKYKLYLINNDYSRDLFSTIISNKKWKKISKYLNNILQLCLIISEIKIKAKDKLYILDKYGLSLSFVSNKSDTLLNKVKNIIINYQFDPYLIDQHNQCVCIRLSQVLLNFVNNEYFVNLVAHNIQTYFNCMVYFKTKRIRTSKLNIKLKPVIPNIYDGYYKHLITEHSYTNCLIFDIPVNHRLDSKSINNIITKHILLVLDR